MGVPGVPGSDEAINPAKTDISLSPTTFVAAILN